uniref:Antifungal peptide 1 n=1 Tax=Trapa natans TaxID=22666 RepID=AFP1_TRANT|nr:RecName: Full=Antifungal peptide 1; Short=Tn-AFP1 [Trapa natans]
LMCTHPLDCSN